LSLIEIKALILRSNYSVYVPRSLINNKLPAKILGLSTDELEKIKVQYPYFNAARMLLLKQQQALSTEKFDHELMESAAWISDRNILHEYLKKRPITTKPLPIEYNAKANDDPKPDADIATATKQKKDTDALSHEHVALKENQTLSGPYTEPLYPETPETETNISTLIPVDTEDIISGISTENPENKAFASVLSDRIAEMSEDDNPGHGGIEKTNAIETEIASISDD
jgi:hypothetical protein